MTSYKLLPSEFLLQLKPFLLDPSYHDVNLICRGGSVVSTSRLLLASFFPGPLLEAFSSLDKVLCDVPITVILPDSSAEDIENLISASVEKYDCAESNLELTFLETYYWCDGSKFLPQDVSKERKHAKSRRVDVVCEPAIDTMRMAIKEEHVSDDEQIDDPDYQEEDDDYYPAKRRLKRDYDDEDEEEDEDDDDDDDEDEDMNDDDDFEVEDRPEKKKHTASRTKKVRKKYYTPKDNSEKKKLRIGAVYGEYAEWDYRSKKGRCKVCSIQFEKDPRALKRHVEREHLGQRVNQKKMAKKLLLQELLSTAEAHVEQQSILETEIVLGNAVKDEKKREKIQEKLDELTAAAYKVGTTGKLYKKEQCAICGKTLCTKYALKKHEDSVHHNIRPFGCELCEKRFIMKNDLRDHISAVHKKIKACVCDICGLKLSTQHGLRVHKLVHEENSKSIQCDLCPKTFRHMCTYRRHIERMHNFDPEKRLKCEECGKFFNHREGLAIHTKKFHRPTDVLYKCHLCSSAYVYRYERTKHLRRSHKMDRRLAYAISAEGIDPEVAAARVAAAAASGAIEVSEPPNQRGGTGYSSEDSEPELDREPGSSIGDESQDENFKRPTVSASHQAEATQGTSKRMATMHEHQQHQLGFEPHPSAFPLWHPSLQRAAAHLSSLHQISPPASGSSEPQHPHYPRQ